MQLNCPQYDNDVFKANFSFFTLILIEMSFIFTLIVNLGSMIAEKQTKMKVIIKPLATTTTTTTTTNNSLQAKSQSFKSKLVPPSANTTTKVFLLILAYKIAFYL